MAAHCATPNHHEGLLSRRAYLPRQLAHVIQMLANGETLHRQCRSPGRSFMPRPTAALRLGAVVTGLRGCPRQEMGRQAHRNVWPV
jgi:hypothetical protein